MPKLPKIKTTLAVGLAAVGIILLFMQGTAGGQSDSAGDVFTEGAASKLLRQMAEGLQGHSARKMLGAFDLDRMDGGALFQQQITAFFNEYETIRVHFKLVEVKEGAAIVDAEMDATPPENSGPPQHKSLQIRLSAARVAAGWKFIDVQPRNFFS